MLTVKPSVVAGTGDLRNLNYFIVNCTANDRVDEKIRNNYLGIARFFRAYFYYNKVKQFGDTLDDKPLDQWKMQPCMRLKIPARR